MKRPWNYARIDKICARCGKEYSVSPRSAKSRWCSQDCSYLDRFGSLRLESKCATCNASFRVNFWRKSHGKGIFCSQQCQWIYKTKAEPKICNQCGKRFLKKPSQIRRHANHFCSQACSQEFHIGINHPRFTVGVGYGREWREISRIIRARDKICKFCGKTPEKNGRALDVHHIVPFYHFGYARRSEAHKETNLLALCRVCHCNQTNKELYAQA